MTAQHVVFHSQRRLCRRNLILGGGSGGGPNPERWPPPVISEPVNTSPSKLKTGPGWPPTAGRTATHRVFHSWRGRRPPPRPARGGRAGGGPPPPPPPLLSGEETVLTVPGDRPPEPLAERGGGEE